MHGNARTLRTAGALALVFLASVGCQAQEVVWLEGEAPTRANVATEPSAWGKAEHLSEGQWLSLNIPTEEVEQRVPEEGLLLDYAFDAPAAGKHEVWGRLGFEFVRSVFEWRIDDGPWDTIDPRVDISTDLMEIQAWNEIAWVRMGEADLTRGAHTLQLRFARRYQGEGDQRQVERILCTIDAFCISPGEFRPNGKRRPGENWRTPEDLAAEEHAFTLPAPAADGSRAELSLAGTWQIARYDEGLVEDRTGPIAKAPPAEELHWSSIAVPGDRNTLRPDLAFCHRYFYRTRVDVPEAYAGRTLLLDFAETNMLTTVFVNGERVGFSDAAAAGFTVDVTDAVRPGEPNEIWVGIKDAYYAIEPTPDEPNARFWFNIPLEHMDNNQGVTMRFDFPVRGQTRNGILDDLTLIATGPAYASDVFALPSVERKELGLHVEVTNPTNSEITAVVRNEVAPSDGGEVELALAERQVTVPADSTRTVSLSEPWADPHLWWPDDPFQYEVVTRIVVGGNVVDTKRTKFGFREWVIDGARFALNGVPWQLRADLEYYDAAPGEGQAAVARWRETGQNMFRLRFQRDWGGLTQNQALDFFDEQGVPVRKTCSTFDGQAASYRLVDWVEGDERQGKIVNAALFDNWRKQVAARVRRQRNHPSIFVWELDNEIIFINTRNFGNLDVVEPEFTKTARLVQELDPSGRGVMVAGGRALVDQTLPINGCHYEASALRDYPDMAYGLGDWTATTDWTPWPMAKDRPIFLSEEYYAGGYNPDWYAAVGGPVCFLGRSDTREACGLIARMFSEGYRWQGLGAFHYWMASGNGTEHYKAWAPVLALCREWNWSFSSGATVPRTLMVRNDTRFDSPIEFAWALEVGGQAVAGDKATFAIPPGEGEVTTITLALPEVTERTGGTLMLSCSRDGAEMWSEDKPLSILPVESPAPPETRDGDVVVWDPQGAAAERLTARGVRFASIAGLDALPEDFRLLVVGANALTPQVATDVRWQRLAAEGKRVIVLEQETPLHYQAVPADLEVTNFTGRVAFPENLQHPVFRGLADEDLFTWSGDHIVYRNAYRKATRGGRSLVQCDESLSCSALTECPVGDGLLVLCQMAVGEKLATDPIGRRLFDNMVDYALNYERIRNTCAVVMNPADPRYAMLMASGLEFTEAADPIPAISDPANDIVIADASPTNLAALADAKEALDAFTTRGGWLMLWGVTPEGLEAFNAVVGVDHMLRPFRRERVSIAQPRDALTSGLSERDVVLYSGERIFGWTADEYVSDDVFTHVVDLEEVAPFMEGPAIEGTASVVNGMTSADAWKYIYYMEGRGAGGDEQWPVWRLPRPETLTGFSIVPNAHYWLMRRAKLVFDGDEANAQFIDLADYSNESNPRQDFELKPVTAQTIAFVPVEWTEPVPQDVLGIDNLWFRAARPDGFSDRVKPLLNIGALVKYPRGTGGVLLNQLRAPETEVVPANAGKRLAMVTTLLRNLNAVFGGGEVILPGEGLTYHPISLEGRCNVYLTTERGWPDGERDLSRLPLGEQRFAGVTYQIRDFRTSPLENAIGLEGIGRDAGRAVTDLTVGRRADALFFLHTLWRWREWRPDGGNTEPPVLFQYVIHYADGRTETADVRYGLGVDHWIQENPGSLRDAPLAWSAPFADDPARQAAIYQFQWTNPRPDVEITSIDLRYPDDAGDPIGVPVLLAVTAAER